MKIGFRAPELEELDKAQRSVLVLYVFADERPFRGIAGLTDWRLNSRIQFLIKRGRYEGAFGESILMPGYHRVATTGILLVGLGERARFDAKRYRMAARKALESLAGMSTFRAALALPPWRELHLRPSQAIETWVSELERVVDQGHGADADILLFEDTEARRAMVDPLHAFVQRMNR